MSLNNTEAIIILTTTASKEEAQRIADYLIETQIAACVNIIPGIISTYRWHGKIMRDNEQLLVIKTLKTVEQRVYEAVKDNHSYETPEIISIPIDKGNSEYLNWITESIRH